MSLLCSRSSYRSGERVPDPGAPEDVRAHRAGVGVSEFRRRCKISYSKVVEFQARGAVHVHAPIRLDGCLLYTSDAADE